MKELGYRWFLFGAQAVNVWGVPRLTADVDLTAEVPEGETLRCITVMGTHGFALRTGADDEFVRRTRVLPFEHRESRMFVDLVLAGSGLEQEFLERASPVLVGTLDIPVITPEDLLISKILAARPKDLEDVRGILRVRGDTLDLGRVRRMLQLLEEAIGQSDLVPAFEQALKDAG